MIYYEKSRNKHIAINARKYFLDHEMTTIKCSKTFLEFSVELSIIKYFLL